MCRLVTALMEISMRSINRDLSCTKVEANLSNIYHQEHKF